MKVPPSTTWTPNGYRVSVELTGTTVVLTCWSEVVGRDGETVGRRPWMVSQLGIPGGSSRPEAERQVKHWIDFYADMGLSDDGLLLFRAAFEKLSELAEQEAQQGSMSYPSSR